MLFGMATRSLLLIFLGILALSLWSLVCQAQDNYEIQVYGSETVAPKTTMVELHSNYIFQGSKTTVDGVLPTQHELHETVEITQGITPWFETGFYIFTAVPNNQGWQWVGDHIHPRVRAPESWHWPVGVSLSAEFGCARPIFSTSVWSLEIRPIVDNQKGRLYWAFNPAFEKAYTGPEASRGWEFAPGREGFLELHQRRGLRSGILQRPGAGRRTRSVPSPIAAVHSGIRFECLAEVGNQFWSGRGRDRRHRPHAGEGDHRPQIRVGQAAFGCDAEVTVAAMPPANCCPPTLALHEIQRGRVHAVAQAGRLGAVIEEVAQVRVALDAPHL